MDASQSYKMFWGDRTKEEWAEWSKNEFKFTDDGAPDGHDDYDRKVAHAFRVELKMEDVQRGFGGPTGSVSCAGPAERIVIEAKDEDKPLKVGVVRQIANIWLGTPDEHGPFVDAAWTKCIVARSGFTEACFVANGAKQIAFFSMRDLGKLTPENELAKKLVKSRSDHKDAQRKAQLARLEAAAKSAPSPKSPIKAATSGAGASPAAKPAAAAASTPAGGAKKVEESDDEEEEDD